MQLDDTLLLIEPEAAKQYEASLPVALKAAGVAGVSPISRNARDFTLSPPNLLITLPVPAQAQ